MLTTDKQTAKKFLLQRSHLNDKLDSLSDYFAKFKVVQVDPLNVVARNQELVLRNRVKDFHRADLERALYGKNRTLFEHWLQLYSIIDLNAYPYLSARRQANLKSDTSQDNFRNSHQKQIKATLKFVTDHPGAVNGKLIEHLPNPTSYLSWGESKSHKALLEYLWDTGELMISHRQGNHKFYDLTRNLVPETLLGHKVTEQESLKFIVKSYFDYLGLVRSAMLSRSGRVISKQLRDTLTKLIKNGSVSQLKISDTKTTYYVWTSEWEDFSKRESETPASAPIVPGFHIMAPLDPLMIDRTILEDLFGFFYRWEVYTPPTKRTVGYYNMPLLYQDEIVGQVALRKNAKGKLQTEGLVWQKDWGKKCKSLLKDEIKRLQSFINQDSG